MPAMIYIILENALEEIENVENLQNFQMPQLCHSNYKESLCPCFKERQLRAMLQQQFHKNIKA